jgi:hypothetical protein
MPETLSELTFRLDFGMFTLNSEGPALVPHGGQKKKPKNKNRGGRRRNRGGRRRSKGGRKGSGPEPKIAPNQQPTEPGIEDENKPENKPEIKPEIKPGATNQVPPDDESTQEGTEDKPETETKPGEVPSEYGGSFWNHPEVQRVKAHVVKAFINHLSKQLPVA